MGSFLEWNVGGWGNTEHGIQAHLASHSTDVNVVERKPGSLEENRWYDVKIEVAGSRVKCFLDGKLIHDVDIPAPILARVYGTASVDRNSGDIILKIVNVDDDPAAAKVQLTGAAAQAFAGEAIVLAGEPEEVNTIVEPNSLRPETLKIDRFEAEQEHEFPPHSLTVLRLTARAVRRLRRTTGDEAGNRMYVRNVCVADR